MRWIFYSFYVGEALVFPEGANMFLGWVPDGVSVCWDWATVLIRFRAVFGIFGLFLGKYKIKRDWILMRLEI